MSEYVLPCPHDPLSETHFNSLNALVICRYGLFADKIPPFLTSEKFLEFCKNPPNGFNFDTKPKKYINYESIRNINIPRMLSIPNPISYRNQCKILQENWDKLLEYFKKKNATATGHPERSAGHAGNRVARARTHGPVRGC